MFFAKDNFIVITLLIFINITNLYYLVTIALQGD